MDNEEQRDHADEADVRRSVEIEAAAEIDEEHRTTELYRAMRAVNNPEAFAIGYLSASVTLPPADATRDLRMIMAALRKIGVIS